MACAVHFSEPVDGDYYTYGGKDFTVCDPTYIGAPIGRQMPDFADKEATLIPKQNSPSTQNQSAKIKKVHPYRSDETKRESIIVFYLLK